MIQRAIDWWVFFYCRKNITKNLISEYFTVFISRENWVFNVLTKYFVVLNKKIFKLVSFDFYIFGKSIILQTFAFDNGDSKIFLFYSERFEGWIATENFLVVPLPPLSLSFNSNNSSNRFLDLYHFLATASFILSIFGVFIQSQNQINVVRYQQSLRTAGL